ncbi:SCP2 sterol-binding domain-containing protein [Micromonospora sp. WMMA1363]|uniref:SCP2 sterol-binding domain-containing protein n=1 Tax=Micromonospora sp. WMMA1363 TaxID=3053985 RepID=UPI00259D2EA5|nr:SCP2 sterol-binding domain-containing protein [Micromonospora sp. WMMA1363]MDM4720222.1 SCP2 sterol-binding domain-containing protein [Micromonospora sp. WMMA1363]
MGHAVESFFASLARRETSAVPPRVRKTLRVDLTAGACTEHWFIDLRAATVRVSRENRPADAVMNTSMDVFERLISGDTSLIAALWRNEAALVGDPALPNALRHFLPARQGSRHPRDVAVARGLSRAEWRARLDATLERTARER